MAYEISLNEQRYSEIAVCKSIVFLVNKGDLAKNIIEN
jgi:hypothetical protein